MPRRYNLVARVGRYSAQRKLHLGSVDTDDTQEPEVLPDNMRAIIAVSRVRL